MTRTINDTCAGIVWCAWRWLCEQGIPVRAAVDQLCRNHRPVFEGVGNCRYPGMVSACQR